MTADFQQLRIKMVDGQLRTTDVTNIALQDAMLAVPREEFVSAGKRDLAYIDEDLEILPARDGMPPRFLMEPSPFARLVQLADVTSADFVLDVGCGTGYSSAVLSRLAGSVVALESEAALAESAAATLERLGCDNVAVTQGALSAGYPGEAPFDVILINGAVDQVPQELLAQLKDGGRLVAIVGTGNAGRAMIFVREGELFSSRTVFNAAVKPLAEFRRQPEFEF
ncbi:protein-L-isoaspartate O-methyltransferase [Aquamicrobium sp. LC103]|uniref:protein-L-isoaspartate O-methyltransferase family protein n=1 Tax=Aquamicrobium sp. LC103 TaxID=1120658 RepID=UPI00063ED34E|nr:protein-L-isoaspartate O-methyltransferase [Aquamicrobium sp. LC103]TKT76749.1 protein-L-isoaspartate O-methyltransferase [Aquamicrobium sp. LC103]